MKHRLDSCEILRKFFLVRDGHIFLCYAFWQLTRIIVLQTVVIWYALLSSSDLLMNHKIQLEESATAKGKQSFAALRWGKKLLISASVRGQREHLISF